ncbi:TP53-binding protein 1-like isoform X1 [Topomyia yanbarensis]|uniref:TP53-binding protein 1-like isoform X1 n=1 Tax=Topomyia yanbarensis TaxID=2498891 RepID=UPI00273B6E30|nr:TP53-binding protein 1-like isoform X1 [Topomyia yanbarensis]
MDAESNLTEQITVCSNSEPTPSEPVDPAVLKEKIADDLKSTATMKGGGDGPDGVPLEKDDLLERLDNIDTSSEAVKAPGAGGNSDNDVDMENDDLIQRLEAMEKGEEDASVSSKGDKKEDAVTEVAHQNGLEKCNEADSLPEEDQALNEEDKMEVDAAEKKDDVSSSDSAVVATATNGDPNHEQQDQPSSSVKRRHSEDEEAVEPSSKKVHVEEAPPSSEESAAECTISAETVDTKVEESVVEMEKNPESENVEEPVTGKEEQSTDESDKKSITSEPEPPILDDNPKVEERDPVEESAPPPGPDPSDVTTSEADENPEKDATDAVNTTSTEVVDDKEANDTEAPPATVDSSTTKTDSEETIDEEKLLESDSKSPESDVEPTSADETVKPAASDEVSAEQPQAENELTTKEEDEPIDQDTVTEQVASEETIAATAVDVTDSKNDDVAAVEVEKPEQDEPVEDKITEEIQAEEKCTTDEAPVSEPVEDVPKSVVAENIEQEPSSEAPQAEAESKSDSLPDTEPNTEPESPVEEQPTSSSPVPEAKSEDTITSSSEPKESAQPNSADHTDTAEEPAEVDAVTSSDEKPSVEPVVSAVEVDSTPEVVTPLTTKEAEQSDEAMEVDSEPAAEEASQAEVTEAPCVEKQAADDVVEAPETTPEQEAAPATIPERQEPAQNPIEEDESMEVDSAPVPTQSKSNDGDVTESMNTSSEEAIESLDNADSAIVADSQSEVTATTSAHNKNLDATEGPENESKADASKVLDDSIESSLPTSSSDKMADRLKQRLDLISNGSSTPNAAVSSSNVYNSTPIQKQFEISSENVSKITRHSVDNSEREEEEHSAIVADNSTVDEKDATVASTSGVTGSSELELTATSKEIVAAVKDESSLKTTESSEVDSCTASSALNTADEINMYASNARKFNGISSTSGSELDEKSGAPSTSITTTAATTTTAANKLDLTTALTSEEALYEVSVWFDGTDLQFLSVERLEQKLLSTGAAGTAVTGSTQDLTGIDSSKQSSNGSVGSLGPFSLPPPRPALDSAMSHSSTTESSSGTSQIKASLSKSKHTVRGAKALASLMIEEFTKIKRALSKEDDDLSDNEQDKTVMKTPRGRPPSSTKKATTGRKRTHTDSDAADDEEPKSKPAAKQAKKGSQKAAVVESPDVEESPKEDTSNYLCCLARWSDRKYYAGKVTGFKGDNKYMVLFEDGASKALSKDVIVIGDKDTLPIKGQSVHALTGGDTYEPGIVQEVKRNEDNEVVYAVLIDEGTVEVTASDMYLTEEQAKAINKACKALEIADEANSPQSSGKRGGSATNTPNLKTPDEPSAASTEKGSRSTRSKRGADKPQTPVTPEAGYSGGVGKKGRRGRSKAQQPAALQTSTISESSDVSDTLEEVNMPAPPSPESGLEAVDGVQPELQRTEKESEIRKMYLVAEYLGNGHDHGLDELLGPIPGSKTLFKNKHFILACTIPPKGTCNILDRDTMKNKYHRFSMAPFVKEHLRQQIETGGGKVYMHFEDIPKTRYKQCKLIAPHPSATAKYVQCLAVDIPAVSHEWIIECCRKLTLLDFKPYALPAGWSLIEERYIKWSCGRNMDQRSTANPFFGCCIQIASLNQDFTEFWSRVCKLAGATVRLIKSETDLTPNLTGYMLTDQEFPENIKLRATRYGLLIVSTVWVVQSLIVGKIRQPDSHEKLTQIYQDDDY